MSSMAGILADLVATCHAGYVLFIIVGLLLILVGWWRGWQWVRNPWFRLIHLFAMLVVAVETIGDVTCPLTDLEKWLRVQAGQEPYAGDFVATLMHAVLFWDLPEWTFTLLHLGCAGVIALVFYLAPPRWPRRRPA